VQSVRATIHVASGFENGNVLVLASDSGLLLVDAQSTQRVAALDTALRRLAPHRVRVVVNTHYHADHTEGNAYFRQLGATVVAHHNVAVQAAKDTTVAEWDNWHRTPLAAAAMPSRPVGDSSSFAFGAERVVLLHAPRSHTDGDLLVWLPRANVLHIGDILEVGAPPFIDWWAGGSLRGMVATIDRVLAFVNDRTAIVPGHGAVSTRADLQRYRQMLLTVDDRVRASVARGGTLAQVLAERPAREWEEAMGGERRAGHFVRLVYYGAVNRR
jgi:cyclase